MVRLRFLFSAATLVSLLSGCSLLRFNLSTGDAPLSRGEADIRLMTRGLYAEAADRIAATADSIAGQCEDPSVRIRAIRWKMRSTRAAVDAAMQRIPEVSLLETWLLYRRMDAGLADTPDSLLFGPATPLARRTAGRLLRRTEALAAKLLPAGRFALMREFVARQPLDRSAAVSGDATLLAWVEYLESHGIDAVYGTGTVAEIVADMGDRLDGQTRQAVDALAWTRDLIDIRLGQDSIRERLTVRLDSLELHFRRVVAVAEDLPGVTEEVALELNIALAQMMDTFDSSVDNAFADLERQRIALQRYVSDERAVLVGQAQDSVRQTVDSLLAALPGLIRRVALWIVLLVVVVLGLPFAAGFWLGGWRARARRSADMPEK